MYTTSSTILLLYVVHIGINPLKPSFIIQLRFKVFSAIQA